jgi:chemotaxis protein CheC
MEEFDRDLLQALQTIANRGFTNAVSGFSGLLGQKLNVAKPTVRIVPLSAIPFISGGPETEAVGIYLRAEGDISGQIMMIIPYGRALELVDLLLEQPEGTTQQLGSLERSALAEVGNQTGTFFLNSMAELIGRSSRPSPPAVMVDMVAAILDIVVATSGGISDEVLLMEADICNGDKSVETQFWVIPDAATLDRIKGISNHE